MTEVKLKIEAMEPTELLSTPSEVFVRVTGQRAGMGDEVELYGEPDEIVKFVAAGWGPDEAASVAAELRIGGAQVAPETIYDLPIAGWAMRGDEDDHERGAR
jgi:hypothetical protein